jgi:hypothetical protein
VAACIYASQVWGSPGVSGTLPWQWSAWVAPVQVQVANFQNVSGAHVDDPVKPFPAVTHGSYLLTYVCNANQHVIGINQQLCGHLLQLLIVSLLSWHSFPACNCRYSAH